MRWLVRHEWLPVRIWDILPVAVQRWICNCDICKEERQ